MEPIHGYAIHKLSILLGERPLHIMDCKKKKVHLAAGVDAERVGTRALRPTDPLSAAAVNGTLAIAGSMVPELYVGVVKVRDN